MKQTVFHYVLSFLLGLLVGAGVLCAILLFFPGAKDLFFGQANSKASPPATLSLEQSNSYEALTRRAYEVASFIRDQNWNALSQAIDPQRGVTFTPYSSVADTDLCFSPQSIAAFGNDNKDYLWGSVDGSGAPLTMKPLPYVQRYVFNTDYTQAPILSINRVMSSGNAVENVADAYLGDQFVELYFPGLDDANEGFDWCGLKLVFTCRDDQFMLVGVIHSEWTT